MKKINYFTSPEFEKKFSKLEKRYKTLSEDLENAKTNAIELFHIRKLNNNSTFVIPGFVSENFQLYKLKKFTCCSIKGAGAKSGIRIIYAFFPKRHAVEFVDIYYKGDRESEDKKRIKSYFKEQIKKEL